MQRLANVTTALCFLMVLGIVQAQEPELPSGAVGLGDLGELQHLSIGPVLESGDLLIRGKHGRQQLIVTGHFSSGQEHDMTHEVTFTPEPSGIVEVDSTGLVTPLADGTVTITAQNGQELAAKTVLRVVQFNEELMINFPNQIVTVFSKLGCNGGGCHGKASGQNGFKLSLLGYEPEEDYEYLVKEVRGRRLFPAAPERSLLLTKSSGQVPHGGGRRMSPEDYEYKILYRWIAQGMPYGKPDDPVIERIEVFPSTRRMNRSERQQLAVTAFYTDGSTEDVTRMAQYEPNDPELASIIEEDVEDAKVWGVMETNDMIGEVAIMARYQTSVDTFRAAIPLGAPIAMVPEVSNFVDELVFDKLRNLGIPPSQLAEDHTFIRRVSIDITGSLPAADQVQQFANDTDPEKRAKLIDRLLESAGYADYFTVKWNAVLRNKNAGGNNQPGVYRFRDWIRKSLYYNKPYDQFVREIIAATGDPESTPGAVWYRSVSQINEQVEDTAQLFLGLRIQCARCHHHPFEKWSQNDYFGFAAFFSRVGKKKGDRIGENAIFHNHGVATAKNPRSGENLKPTPLDAPTLALAPDQDPRHKLVDWMAEPDNRFFAHSLVNRYWKHFFDRGLVEPEDDMRVTNPPSNPQLLEALAQHFIASGFDLKELVRTITNSTTYQLSSIPNEYNVGDKQQFSRYYPKRLPAEVLYDAIHQVTNTKPNFGNNYPAGTRTIELKAPNQGNYFLTIFGRPQADSACECERSSEANLAQSLHMLNSSEIQSKLSDDNGRAALLAKQADRALDDKVRELYHWFYARPPDGEELQVALGHIDSAEEDKKREAYEDVVWALLQTKEFLFNH